MKILVTGLGAMGTSHGWALAQAGADVWHVVRNPKASRASGSIAIDLLDLRS
jgi:ketopantoate reductase